MSRTRSSGAPRISARTTHHARRGGFTVIELLIAGFIGLAVVLAVGTLYIGAENSFRVGSRKLVAQQEATLLSGTISRLTRVGAGYEIYSVPTRTVLADSGNGLAILDGDGAVLGRIEWDGTAGTLVDAGGGRVTVMRLLGVKFKKDPARPRSIIYRYATDDEKGNLVNIESTVSMRN